MMKLAWQCMFTPRLYKVYKDGPRESVYQPLKLEKWGDRVITSANTIWNMGLYTSPFICMYIYKRGFFSLDELRTMTKLFGGVGCLIAISMLIRGIGRAANPKYAAFVRALSSPRNEYLQNVRKYDFDFSAWEVTYSVPPKRNVTWMEKHPFAGTANGDLPLPARAALQLLAFAATHTFGLRLIYPGSLAIINNLLWGALFSGRTYLVEQYDGKRTKIRTAEGNNLDTMFVDMRGERGGRGDVLVVCCEGNSGFYEVGIMLTPVKAGYSALGWNHPGFAGSTGQPFPEQEQNAIDAVMQFAINQLNFSPDKIVMFGWSIGGYTASWAAVNYPVRALVLDATFDDLLPLAQNTMPAWWGRLVREVVRSYVDLNVSDLLAKYNGPVRLVRRTDDEIISLRPGMLTTNRGNELLARLLATRHPDAVDLDSDQRPLEKYVALLDSQRAAILRNGVPEHEMIVLQLIAKYMSDYKSSHCTPLPENVFEAIVNDLTADK